MFIEYLDWELPNYDDIMSIATELLQLRAENARISAAFMETEAIAPDGSMSGSIAKMQEELEKLRADALTSQSHNAAVIDRIVTQLRDAGYLGTLSEMVDAACSYCKWYDADKFKFATSVNVKQGTAMIIVNPNDSDKFLPQSPEVTK